MYSEVYSEYAVKNSSIKFPEDTVATKIGCVGSMEETMNVKTITKNCEGVMVKTVVKPDGTGEIALSLHMKYDLFLKTYGMVSDGLVDGVYAYGRGTSHKPFCLTCEVEDEDGVKKLKAYPNVVVKDGMARSIENGAEEVAEMEITLTIMPDEYGIGMYEALESEITEETVKTDWLNNFSSELVRPVSG